MTELHRPELDFDRLERVIKQEVALAVKLLRYLNSAGFGWRHEGDVHQARPPGARRAGRPEVVLTHRAHRAGAATSRRSWW
jgi:hypothetical protein